MASTTVEPWGDSPRAVYATVADIGLAFGLAFLPAAASQLRRITRWREFTARWGILVCALATVAVAIPLWISATNSLEASSIGQGGPSIPIVVLGGVGLGLGLAALMTRRTGVGLRAGIALGTLLLAAAFVTAR
jgi:hypothetical protein